MSAILIYLFTFALVAFSWATVVAKLDSSEKKKCRIKGEKCWIKLALPEDWNCESDEPADCRFRLLQKLNDERLCKNYNTFHNCVTKYKKAKSECKEFIAHLDEHDAFLNVTCAKNKAEMSAVASCMSKASVKKCIAAYNATNDEKICEETDTFSECLKTSFKKENCSMNAKKAVVSALQDAIHVPHSKCKLDNSGAASWDVNCESDEPADCRFRLLQKLNDERLCKNYNTFHNCVTKYKKAKSECKEFIAHLDEHDAFLNVTCAKNKAGCNFDETLCEKSEVCLPDGLFGQCYSDGESEVLKPLVIESALDPYTQELLRLELRRLANAGLNWPHARAQCTLAYFKFSIIYGLPYDAQFCAVRNPNNIWALIQEVQTVLASESEAREDLVRESLVRNGFLRDSDVEDSNANASENGAAEEPADAIASARHGVFSALLLDGNAGDKIIAPKAGDNSDGDDEESQLRPTNMSAAFDAAIEQLQGKEKRSSNGQIAIDLANDNNARGDENDYSILSRIPPGILVDGDDEDASNAAAAVLEDAQAAERSAAWNAWLTAMLAAGPRVDPLQPVIGSADGKASLPELSAGEEKQLDDYVTDMLNNRRADLSALNDSQLEKLLAFINSIKVMLQQKAAQLQQQAASESSAPEMEEVIPLTSQSNERQRLLKKDAEKFDNSDMGLSNTVHKIVKGGIQRVEGDRVYLKVNEHAHGAQTIAPLSETQLTRLIDFLDRKIAAPNNLFFDEFAYENGQLSFHVSRIKFLPALQQIFDNLSLDDLYDDEEEASGDDIATAVEKTDGDKEHESHAATSASGDTNSDSAKKGQPAQLDSVSGVAQAVYKRRKDIESLAGVEVDETGIGSGVDIVPVGGVSRRDWFFATATAICAVSLVVVASVLAVQLMRARKASVDGNDLKKTASGANLPEVIDYIEGKPATTYEDLCRQRMSGQDAVVVPVPGPSGTSNTASTAPAAVSALSKHSSTSSWPDDTYLQPSNLDISTGHVILGFLKDCLEKPDEISNQWSQLSGYQNSTADKNIAQQPENADKNFDAAIVPYDDSVITISPSMQFRMRSRPSSNEQQTSAQQHETDTAVAAQSGERKYVNASRIFDADPRQVAYIAAQAPLANTVTDFWQVIWQEGVVVIVNLTDWSDNESPAIPVRYWPSEEEGSKIFGALEVNLVSEHSFNKDYVVRSIYLKNLNTNETRTVTQFHYVSWKDGGLPRSIESLLEFRRKVNKSYRGHSSPVLVHCTNGAGRSGTYILIDMVMNRILKGVKELNIAASLEHLRDQRMCLIDNEAQYKLVFRCVAEEVSMLLKNLQH